MVYFELVNKTAGIYKENVKCKSQCSIPAVRGRNLTKVNFKAASFSYMFLKTKLVLLHSAKSN